VTDETRTLARHRLERAREALDEARLLIDKGHTNAFVSRLYYGCFYAVSALLLLEGHGPSKHSGVRALFHQRFVRPQIFNRELGRFYDRLFDNRQKADYADLVTFDPADVRPWLDEALDFVDELSKEAENRMQSEG
jgi:uncharacterized protein (UPF0332 family)